MEETREDEFSSAEGTMAGTVLVPTSEERSAHDIPSVSLMTLLVVSEDKKPCLISTSV